MKEIKAKAAASQAAKLKRLSGGHMDAAADRSLVKRMVKPSALTGKATGGALAKGGKASKTTVNVVVAPQSPARAAPVAAGQAPRAAAAPSRPSVPVSPAAAPSSGGLAPLAGIQPGAKRGGKVKRADGGRLTGYDAGADSGPGRLEKAAHMRRKARAS